MPELPEGMFDLKEPCADCPFRKEGGVRHSLAMMTSYISYFLGWPGATFPCHRSVPKSDTRTQWSVWQPGQVMCAGGLIFAGKHGVENAVMIAGRRCGAYDKSKLKCEESVFDTADEMLAAASVAWKTGSSVQSILE